MIERVVYPGQTKARTQPATPTMSDLSDDDFGMFPRALLPPNRERLNIDQRAHPRSQQLRTHHARPRGQEGARRTRRGQARRWPVYAPRRGESDHHEDQARERRGAHDRATRR